jgi:hypothetical protein
LQPIEKDIAALKEVVNKPEGGKNWRAEIDGQYFVVGVAGDILRWGEHNSICDDFCYNTLNYFRTKEEAEAKKAYDIAVGKVSRMINELNWEWEPNWDDSSEFKYHIFYDNNNDTYTKTSNSYVQYRLTIPYIKSGGIAEQIIKECKSDLDVIFKK